ncbi:phosphopentomutase [Candidatus Nitrospira bockiana]
MTRVILLVVDGFGVGALPDAEGYGDAGTNTLAHVADAVGGLRVPGLEMLGLGHVGTFAGIRRTVDPDGCFGKMAFLSKGKDSVTGHWELCGVVVERAFPTYPHGFPADLIEAFEGVIGRKVLGNRAASGTEIIKDLGAEHLRTGRPIVYTSADSVFQIAAHEDVIPVDELYAMCRAARKLLKPPHLVGRVIARPFIGEPGHFIRTPRRKDFSVAPIDHTLLDRLNASGQPVVGVGKIDDLFAGRGLTRSIHAGSDAEHLDDVLKLLKTVPRGLIFVNLGDFDTRYAHRNDARGWARALETMDAVLVKIMEALRPDDAVFVTGDHGNDPTTPSTDHSREYVPLLVYGPRLARGVNLGIRRTAADVGQTIAEALRAPLLGAGQSFLAALGGHG